MRDEEFLALKRQRKKRRRGSDAQERSATVVAVCPAIDVPDIEEPLRLSEEVSEQVGLPFAELSFPTLRHCFATLGTSTNVLTTVRDIYSNHCNKSQPQLYMLAAIIEQFGPRQALYLLLLALFFR